MNPAQIAGSVLFEPVLQTPASRLGTPSVRRVLQAMGAAVRDVTSPAEHDEPERAGRGSGGLLDQVARRPDGRIGDQVGSEPVKHWRYASGIQAARALVTTRRTLRLDALLAPPG